MRLVFEQVSYRYDQSSVSNWALRDASFEIVDGDFVGIIGHSGSGKSTLIQLAAALIKPTEGKVLLDELDLGQSKNRNMLFKRIGVAFQYPEAQLFARTVYDDIAFAARNARLSEAEVDSRVHHWMQVFGLSFEKHAQRSPFELSGGEQRRVALAGIMIIEPELLILDEPTAGLDPAGRQNLLKVIEDYHRAGNTVVMVSHSMEDVALVTNRILVLKDGMVYLQGSPSEVFAHAEDLQSMDLGVPESESIARTLRAAGVPLPPALLDVNSLADAIVGLSGSAVSRFGKASDG